MWAPICFSVPGCSSWSLKISSPCPVPCLSGSWMQLLYLWGSYHMSNFSSGFWPSVHLWVSLLKNLLSPFSSLSWLSLTPDCSPTASALSSFLELIGTHPHSFLPCNVLFFHVLGCDYNSLVLIQINGQKLAHFTSKFS